MLSAVPRWRWQGEARAAKVRLARDGGAVVLDSREQIHLLDASGTPLWRHTLDDSARDIGVDERGREAFGLSVREVSRLGPGGRPTWRVSPPPFPVRMAVRRDGLLLAISAGQGLVRFLDAGTGRQLGGTRLTHPADHLALLAVDVVQGGRGAPPMPPTLTVVVSERGEVTLLDHTGNPHWTLQLGAVAGPPDAAHDRIVVPSFDGIHSWLLDGTPAGLIELGNPAAPAVRALLDDSGERLLALDARQRLFVLSTRDGGTLWHTQLPSEAVDLAFSGDGSGIAVALRTGSVERLALADGPPIATGAAVLPSTPFPSAAVQDPGDSGGFLEVPDAPRLRPSLRWRSPVETPSPRLVLPRDGGGVLLLDDARGELSYWSGGTLPAWRVAGIGARPLQIATADAGEPVVVAGPSGLRFLSARRGPVGGVALSAACVSVARSGTAVLVGSSSARLHLFDAEGRPVWDVPTPGFEAIAISASGNELAIARPDGSVVFQVRGRSGGWTRTLSGSGDLAGDPEEPGHVPVLIHVREDGLVFANGRGRVGFVGLDGRIGFDARLAPGRAAAELLEVGGELVVRDDGGGWSRITRDPWAVVPLPKAGGTGRSVFAFAMDRLVEIRYDSKEIASIDAVSGAVLWKRALTELPKAVAVAADGSCLAAVVSGELVLYDLLAEGSGPVSGPDSQRFLEL